MKIFKVREEGFKILEERFQKLNPGKHYLLWGLEMELGEGFEERKDAALMKLAVDCGIPKPYLYTDITNEAVWGFFVGKENTVLMWAYINMRPAVEYDPEDLALYKDWLVKKSLEDTDDNMWTYFEERRKENAL